MRAWLTVALAAAVAELSCATMQRSQPAPTVNSFGFGLPATEEQIRAWDTDVRPDGQGLPVGRGTVAQGASIYALKCAACHGERGRDGPFDRLVGREPREGFGFGRDSSLKRTVGSYWPYATTLFDYTRRAMPWMSPGSLGDDEVYALVAYLLFLNEIVPEGAVMDADSLPRVVMPARDRFVRDNRRGGSEIR